MDFAELKAKYHWTPIRNCPGRFVLRHDDLFLAPETLAGPGVEFREYSSEKAADAVVVGRCADGGLISYRRADGTYLHTLNTAEGFARKLSQLGIRF